MTQTRDQKRAAHAYKCVSEVEPSLRKDYNARVNGLGAQVIRSGLAATVAFLERDRDSAAVKLLFKHLLDANIPGVKRDPRTPAQDETRVVPDSVRALELEDYMLATQEFLAVALWFRRAVQAEPPYGVRTTAQEQTPAAQAGGPRHPRRP